MHNVIIFCIYSMLWFSSLFFCVVSGNYSWWQVIIGTVGFAACLWFANSSAIDYDKQMNNKIQKLEDKIAILTEMEPKE